MKLSEMKNILKDIEYLKFKLPNGETIPNHFHVTEVGLTTKHFIDCGGTVREERNANFQIWVANDTDHKLTPEKLTSIINLSEKALSLTDLDIEVEYQSDTIGRYNVSFKNGSFTLEPKQTNCLAMDHCGISKEDMPTGEEKEVCCTPSGGCC